MSGEFFYKKKIEGDKASISDDDLLKSNQKIAELSEREIEASLDRLADEVADLFLAHIESVQKKKLKIKEQ